ISGRTAVVVDGSAPTRPHLQARHGLALMAPPGMDPALAAEQREHSDGGETREQADRGPVLAEVGQGRDGGGDNTPGSQPKPFQRLGGLASNSDLRFVERTPSHPSELIGRRPPALLEPCPLASAPPRAAAATLRRE